MRYPIELARALQTDPATLQLKVCFVRAMVATIKPSPAPDRLPARPWLKLSIHF